MISSSSAIVESRAHLLGRVKIVFDLLLLGGLIVTAAPRSFLFAPVADMAMVAVYLRYVKQQPAALTGLALASWALLLVMAPVALGLYGMGAWALFPLIPVWAAFVLTRRVLVWQTALITGAIVLASLALWSRTQITLTMTPAAVLVMTGSALAGLAGVTWPLLRLMRPESGTRDLLAAATPVTRGIVVVPLNWIIGSIQTESLRRELLELQQQHNARWIVLDLAPGGAVSRHDLIAIEQAAGDLSSAQCTVVIARPPVDTIGHLDVAQPAVGRTERFATVAQATEAGLRRLGWTQQADQARRIVTTY